MGGDTLCTGGGHQAFLPLVIGGSFDPPPTADVRVTYIEFDPPGDDVEGEYVQVDNVGIASATITDWTLEDDANHTFAFPPFTLNAGASVRVWVKSGSDTATDVFWGHG